MSNDEDSGNEVGAGPNPLDAEEPTYQGLMEFLDALEAGWPMEDAEHYVPAVEASASGLVRWDVAQDEPPCDPFAASGSGLRVNPVPAVQTVCTEKIAMPCGSGLQANLVQPVPAGQMVQVVCGQETVMQHQIAPPNVKANITGEPVVKCRKMGTTEQGTGTAHPMDFRTKWAVRIANQRARVYIQREESRILMAVKGPKRVYSDEEEKRIAKIEDTTAYLDALGHLDAIVPRAESACSLRPCLLILTDTANYIDRLIEENGRLCQQLAMMEQREGARRVEAEAETEAEAEANPWDGRGGTP